MIRIKELNRQELKELVTSRSFESMQFWPITPHRAISQIKNPRVDDEDILLLLAYDGEEMVGYLGVLADWIFLKNSKRSKCGWLSCMWINPLFRGKGISYKLVNSALEKWNHKILVTEFTVPAKGLYDKIGAFNDLAILSGVRLYRRWDLAKILPPKKNLFKRMKRIWQGVDMIGNTVCDLRFLFHNPKIDPLKIEYVNTVDKEAAEFISKNSANLLFKRMQSDLDWILHNPWIWSDPGNTNSDSKYYFSSVADDFSFFGIKINDNAGQLIGFLLLSKRDLSLKIPYAYFEKEHLNDIIRVINLHLNKWQIKTISVFNHDLASYYKNSKSGFLYKKEMIRHYIITKLLSEYLPNSFEIQDGDGDAAFT